MRGCFSSIDSIRDRSRVFPAYAGLSPPPCPSPNSSRCSPLMRGCLASLDLHAEVNAVFPAYARLFHGNGAKCARVYGVPRLRGVVSFREIRFPHHRRCSPLTRGCLRFMSRRSPGAAVFPAYAGLSPETAAAATYLNRVPPLMRGLSPCHTHTCRNYTSVPRLRGVVSPHVALFRAMSTCSPLTRGCFQIHQGKRREEWVFPADAGLSRLRSGLSPGVRGVPRLRGIVSVSETCVEGGEPCSPLTRGCLQRGLPVARRSPVFPANAGLSPDSRCTCR